MMPSISSPMHASRQTGAALVTGLIFLVVLTMIGVTAARMSTLEERMSGNMRDRAIAMQAAELALRDAEHDIMNTDSGGNARNLSGKTSFSTDCGASTGSTADDGLCDRRAALTLLSATTIRWPAFTVNGNNTALLDTDMTAAPGVIYGTFTSAPPITIAGIAITPPRYVMERFEKNIGGTTYYYRITARAQGVNANTVVWLQEIFQSNI